MTAWSTTVRAESAESGGGVPQRFGRVVRQLRAEHGWSQEALANRADLNRSYMGEIERAAVVPSLAIADKLAQALGLSLLELIACCERSERR
jgi:transcriptional regulator with XRE-family HTH domain